MDSLLCLFFEFLEYDPFQNIMPQNTKYFCSIDEIIMLLCKLNLFLIHSTCWQDVRAKKKNKKIKSHLLHRSPEHHIQPTNKSLYKSKIQHKSCQHHYCDFSQLIHLSTQDLPSSKCPQHAHIQTFHLHLMYQ